MLVKAARIDRLADLGSGRAELLTQRIAAQLQPLGPQSGPD